MPVARLAVVMALAALGEGVGGTGGPNVPPPDDPPSAQLIAQSPDGPMPLLRDEHSAEHVPGCNLAVWKGVLEELQRFDPAIVGAEDLELEWRMFDSGRAIGYHPSALVWHHRRPPAAIYLRQQRNYGRGHALIEYRYPERFPRGFRLRKVAALLRRSEDASAGSFPIEYLSLPSSDGPLTEIAHQWGVPAAATLAGTAPLWVVNRRLAAPALSAIAHVVGLFCFDVVAAGAGSPRPLRTTGFRRARLAVLRLLRPLAFRWGHLNCKRELRNASPNWPQRPADHVPAPAPLAPSYLEESAP